MYDIVTEHVGTYRTKPKIVRDSFKLHARKFKWSVVRCLSIIFQYLDTYCTHSNIKGPDILQCVLEYTYVARKALWACYHVKVCYFCWYLDTMSLSKSFGLPF